VNDRSQHVGSRGRILIVDDEPNIRLLFRAALESAGYEVEEAADGDEGLASLSRYLIDLILLDLHMPNLGGMEVLRRIRDEVFQVPVVIVTAHGSVPDAVEAMRLGAVDFISKPLTPGALRRVVEEMFERHAEPTRVTADGQFAANLSRAKRAFNRQDLDQAEVFLRQAIGLAPDSAEAHNLMGVLHEARGEPLAFVEYEAALKAAPDYEPARHNMARFYTRIYSGREDLPPDAGID
jgi:DNA-binding response OmpR family regulator